MTASSPETRVREARACYFADNGFSDAGYQDRWVKVKLGPIPIYIPNSPSRKRAIPLHDLHHVATGYATVENDQQRGEGSGHVPGFFRFRAKLGEP